MGLDLVELTMEIEDTFGLSIPDDDASKLETVGQTYDYIRSRIVRRPGGRCSSMVAFNQLRRAMVGTFGVPRELVRLETPLEVLFPRGQLQWRLMQVQQTAGLVVPPVVLPINRLATCLVSSAAIAVSLAIPILLFDGLAAWLGAIASLWLISTAYRWRFGDTHAHPHRVSSRQHVRDFVRKVVVMNQLPAITNQWTDERIWLTLTEIISEQLGVRVEDLKPETDYVRDLDAG